jgi:hypothetical protein
MLSPIGHPVSPTSAETGVKMTNPRAVRYRRLALAESDLEKARLLQQIADEADRGVLVTADWMTTAKYMGKPPEVT